MADHDEHQRERLGCGDIHLIFVPFFGNFAAHNYRPAPPAGFTCDSADFDGTNDYMTRGADLTGIADGKAGTFSGWVRIDAGDNTARVIALCNSGVGSAGWAIQINSSNVIQVTGRNAAGTTRLSLITSGTYLAGATWYHFLCSWDLAATARHLYVNDAAPTLGTDTAVDDTLDYTKGDFGIGARTAGDLKWNGCLAEVFFHTTYIDISDEANRRKFISATGKPVSLGADGSTPLGVQPLVYCHLADGADVTDFGVNLGSGEGFTITGTLDIGSTSPSD